MRTLRIFSDQIFRHENFTMKINIWTQYLSDRYRVYWEVLYTNHVSIYVHRLTVLSFWSFFNSSAVVKHARTFLPRVPLASKNEGKGPSYFRMIKEKQAKGKERQLQERKTDVRNFRTDTSNIFK